MVEFLNQKGYSASKQRIEHYYKTNEPFLKQLLKAKGKIIPGWNDTLEATDLELSPDPNKTKLVSVPDEDLTKDLPTEQKQEK